MQIVFWQNIPSIHQAPFIKALSKLCALIVVCENDVPERRKQMGWILPDFGMAKLIVKPDLQTRQSILQKTADADCIHIFSGFDMTPLNNQTLKSAIKLPCKTAVYLERPQSFPWLKKIIRKLKYSLYACRYHATDYLFPIGNMATNYYADCGFEIKKIYPLAYFVDGIDAQIQQKSNAEFHFVYVGRDIPLKRMDLIIQALAELSEYQWQCDFIGVQQEAAAQYNISEALKTRMTFHGILSNEAAQAIMASSDVLILPSRYDGWGAVVSEALLNGTKVIVSSEVGAKDLVENAPSRGHIFQSGSVRDLQQKMQEALQKGPLNPQERAQIKDWAAKAIAPETGARYFLDCLQHADAPDAAKPQIPWI